MNFGGPVSKAFRRGVDWVAMELALWEEEEEGKGVEKVEVILASKDCDAVLTLFSEAFALF